MIGWLLGHFATARTFLGAFKGPCLILALVAGLAGVTVGAAGARVWYRGEVAEARQQLAEFRAESAIAAAARQSQAIADLIARDQSITASVDAIPAAVAKLVAPQFAKLRESVNDTRFACLQYALPDDFLRELRRPAGSALENH